MPTPDARSPHSAPSVSLMIPAGAITLVAQRPAFVSQKTSLDIIGIPSDRFLAMVRAPGFPLRVRVEGKLRFVETEPLIAFLRELGASAPNLDNHARPVESGAALAAEPSPESDVEAARKLGAAIGFQFSDPPASNAPALQRRGK